MIWGIDHIVMSISSHARVEDQLSGLGFVPEFIEMAVPSAPEKSPVLSQHRPLHDIGFFRPSGVGLAIETIAHGDNLDPTPGPYAPVFNVSSLPEGVPQATMSAALGSDVIEKSWGNGRAFFYQADEPVTTLNTLGLDTTDVSSEARFWTQCLGFREISKGDGWALLETNTPVAAWSGRLLLKHSDTVSTGPMDGAGFTCVALVSNNIDTDLETAFAHGGINYDCRFEISVNGRPLIVALFRTPSGAIVEFIQNVT